MAHKINHFNIPYLFIFGLFITLFATADIVYATPIYAPGETLNPSCLPTNSDCTVTTPPLLTGNNTWTGLQYFSGNASTTEISSSGSAYFATSTGNVGIGTSTPGYKLDISGGNIHVDSADQGFGLILSTPVRDNSGRSIIQFANNSLAPIVGDDYANQVFAFLSGWNSTRSNDAQLRVYGKETGAFTKYLQITHDGSNGYITPNYGNLIFSSNSSKVGIGTTTPNTILTVRSTGANGINLDSDAGDATQSNRLFFSNGTTGQGISIRNSSGLFTFATGATAGSGSGTTRMVLDSNGYLGLGTSSPSWKFQMADIRPSMVISDTSAGTNAKHWFTSSQGGNYYIGTSSDALNATSTYLTIANGGNVGIGTTNPITKLQVSDGNTASTSLVSTDPIVLSYQSISPGFSIIASNDTTGNRAVFKGVRSRGTLANPTAPIVDDDVLTFLGSIFDGVATQSTAGVFFKVDGDVSSGVAPQRISFVTSETSGSVRTEKMVIRANGNVGIGTSTPGNKLTIYDTSRAAIGFSGASGNNYKWTMGMDVANGGRFAIASSTALGTTDRFVIDGNGYVGIGTTTPKGLLHIADTTNSFANAFLLDFSGGFTNRTLKVFRPNQNNIGIQSVVTSSNDQTSTSLSLQANGGNVGIGSTTPYASLSVKGAGGTTGVNFQTTNSSDSPLFTILDNGNVGIGTSTPNALLNVASTLPYIYLSDTDAAANNKHWFLENNAGTFGIGTTSDSLSVSNTRAFKITSTGQVQIGQTGDSGARLVLTGGAAGSAMVTLNRPNSAQFSWLLAGGGLTFADDTNGFNVTNILGDNGMNQLYIGQRSKTGADTRASIISASSFGSGAGTDINGGALEIIAGRGNGAGIPGDLKFSTGVATASGTTAQSTSTRMTISGNTGYVGVATSSPWRTFDVNGTVGFKGLSTGVGSNYLCIDTTTNEVLRGNGSSCTASSQRFKDNITDLSYGLSDVMALRPVSFIYKPEMNMGSGTHLGFIAEEVAQIIPELVSYGKDGQIQGLDYPTVTAVLTKAIQQQQTEYSNLLHVASSTASSIESLTVNQNLATSTLFSLNKDISELTSQVSSLNLSIEGLRNEFTSSTTVTAIGDALATSTSFMQKMVDSVGLAIRSTGEWIMIKITATTALFADLTADKITIGTKDKPSGITMYDEITGNPYCTKVSNGALVTSAGECGIVKPAQTTTQITPIVNIPSVPIVTTPAIQSPVIETSTTTSKTISTSTTPTISVPEIVPTSATVIESIPIETVTTPTVPVIETNSIPVIESVSIPETPATSVNPITSEVSTPSPATPASTETPVSSPAIETTQ